MLAAQARQARRGAMRCVQNSAAAPRKDNIRDTFLRQRGQVLVRWRYFEARKAIRYYPCRRYAVRCVQINLLIRPVTLTICRHASATVR